MSPLYTLIALTQVISFYVLLIAMQSAREATEDETGFRFSANRPF